MTTTAPPPDASCLAAIEQRLRALEDAEAIQNLKARYAAYCDAQYDCDGIAALFTEDAVWESPSLGRFEGREAIRAFFRGASGDLHVCDPLQPEWPHRSERRYGEGAMVPIHAVHGRRDQSGVLARRHRPGTLRPRRRQLAVQAQDFRASHEHSLRDRLGEDAVRVRATSIAAGAPSWAHKISRVRP